MVLERLQQLQLCSEMSWLQCNRRKRRLLRAAEPDERKGVKEREADRMEVEASEAPWLSRLRENLSNQSMELEFEVNSSQARRRDIPQSKVRRRGSSSSSESVSSVESTSSRLEDDIRRRMKEGVKATTLMKTLENLLEAEK